jgi:hypothetical protein
MKILSKEVEQILRTPEGREKLREAINNPERGPQQVTISTSKGDKQVTIRKVV